MHGATRSVRFPSPENSKADATSAPASVLFWWARPDSNREPKDYESPAPPLSYRPKTPKRGGAGRCYHMLTKLSPDRSRILVQNPSASAVYARVCKTARYARQTRSSRWLAMDDLPAKLRAPNAIALVDLGSAGEVGGNGFRRDILDCNAVLFKIGHVRLEGTQVAAENGLATFGKKTCDAYQ